ncbi:EAL domain-containing protein [Candidatus Kuenenia sp.]|uniref:putative bifunctional diguanylate cyclase/phosphodiesterase n=1 Tax=Candidatus Kuenenia sp. TaxID=2499824 RepID=UPI0032207329
METDRKSTFPSINTVSLAAQICSGVVAGVGAIGLLGWISNSQLLASIRPNYIPMAPNTAVVFVVLGITLFTLIRWHMNLISRWIAWVAAIFVVPLNVLSLTQYVTNIDFGIDQMLLVTTKTLGGVPMGVMSPITAANFLLSGFSVSLVSFSSVNRRYMKNIASCLAIVIASIGSVVILGYLYKTPLLYGGTIVPMALTTAITFVFLGIGLISVTGLWCWPQCLVMGSSTRARLLRAFLPVTVGTVIIMGWFHTIIAMQSRSNPALLASLLAILFMVIVSIIISYTAKLIGHSIDLAETKRKLAEVQLRKLSQAIEQSSSTVVITDTKGTIEYVNPKFTQLTGYTAEEAIGQNPRLLKSGKTSPEEYKRLWDVITSGGEWMGKFYNRKKTGVFYWESASISPIKNQEGVITHFLAVKEDITERKRFEAHLEHLANNDPLTNLFNRRRFREELEGWVAQMERHESNGALLFIDLDNFKYINDTLGHQKGDEILINFAHRLRARVRETDIIARLGGDEFAIILPYTDADQAQSIAMQIMELSRVNLQGKNDRLHSVTSSIGIALFPEHGGDVEKLLTYADLAMYRAKEKGRNCVCTYSPDQKIHYELRMDWEERIRDALKNNRFVLHLQPISNIRHKKIMGYEALLRMVDENNALTFPSEFLTIAERFGLIRDIDRWVVRRSIHLIAEQQFTDRGLFLDVNLSGKAFSDPELLPLIKQEFEATNINPATLIFEITETATIENMVDAHRLITTLKDMGCRFGLDDFGIGFSSFSYLKQLPVDFLKIDGSFISELKHNHTDQHMVRAMVEVARGLGKQTIAEFVGCEETVQLLSNYGVDYAQGYHIGKPFAISEIDTYSEIL